MKRSIAIFLILACFGLASGAQDAGSVILTYQRNFVRSSLGTKLELLKTATAEVPGAGGSGESAVAAVDMGPLYDTALRFVMENAGLLAGDLQLRELALIAIRRAGESSYAASADKIWSLFQIYSKDQELRAAAINAYARAGFEDQKTTDNLNVFLASQNTLFRSGVQPEYPALEACIVALGFLGSGSSFPVLFSTYVAGYNQEVQSKAAEALGNIKGDYKSYLKEVIAKNSPLEKAAALRAGLENKAFGPDARGELAEAALAAGLDWTGDSPVELAAVRQLRLVAVRELRDQHWQRAAPLAVRHFRGLLTDYNEGRAAESELLDAISCLGAMGSTEAAQALALYLQLINAQTEQGRPYDEDLLIGVIQALGELGDKVAFDYLLYIGYLQYPESVKNAAKEALQQLKW